MKELIMLIPNVQKTEIICMNLINGMLLSESAVPNEEMLKVFWLVFMENNDKGDFLENLKIFSTVECRKQHKDEIKYLKD